MASSQANPQGRRNLEAAYTVTGEKMEEILSIGKSSVCMLNATSEDGVGFQGSAGFYKLEQNHWALITNNHVVQFTDNEFISSITLTFELHMGFSLKMRAEYVVHVTTSRELDATIIEITEEFMLKLKNLGVNFLKDKPAEVNQKVAFISYPNGAFSIDKGVIENVEGFTLSYYMGGDKGSSGAPILTWDFFAIGIHKWRGDDSGIVSLGAIRVGTSLKAIIEFHRSSSRSFTTIFKYFKIKFLHIVCNLHTYEWIRV